MLKMSARSVGQSPFRGQPGHCTKSEACHLAAFSQVVGSQVIVGVDPNASRADERKHWATYGGNFARLH